VGRDPLSDTSARAEIAGRVGSRPMVLHAASLESSASVRGMRRIAGIGATHSYSSFVIRVIGAIPITRAMPDCRITPSVYLSKCLYVSMSLCLYVSIVIRLRLPPFLCRARHPPRMEYTDEEAPPMDHRCCTASRRAGYLPF